MLVHQNITPTGPNFKKMYTIKPIRNKFDRLVREALEIQRHESGPKHHGINLDNGQHVNNTFWVPFNGNNLQGRKRN